MTEIKEVLIMNFTGLIGEIGLLTIGFFFAKNPLNGGLAWATKLLLIFESGGSLPMR